MVTPRGYVSEEWGSGGVENGGVGEWGSGESMQLPHSPISPNPYGQAGQGRDLYPLTLTGMAHKRAIVAGGGPVGQRKVAGLLQSGAAVRLVSPEATPDLREWAQSGRIEWRRRPYQKGDLAGFDLAFAATNQRSVNVQVGSRGPNAGPALQRRRPARRRQFPRAGRASPETTWWSASARPEKTLSEPGRLEIGLASG